MKRFIYHTLLCCAVLVLGSCSMSDELANVQMGSDNITITTSLSGVQVTRAEDTSVERTIKHIDVFVVGCEGVDAGKVVYYERNTTGNSLGVNVDGSGTLTLAAKRSNSSFEVDKKYAFYLVANASISAVDAQNNLTTLDELESWIQGDEQIHVTGTALGGGNPPQTFLMQGVASVAGSEQVVINNSAGNSEDLALSAILERAAAKIVIKIKQGDDVEFYQHLTSADDAGNALYYYNMLPTKTCVLPKNSVTAKGQELVTTPDLGPNEHTYIWTPTAGHSAATPKYDIEMVGYAYAHDWHDLDPVDETCLIVNIPLKWNKDGDDTNGKEVVVCNSWYLIPLSQQEKLERNKCYVVSVTINTAGASDRTSVVEVDGIEFETLPWQEVEIGVGETENDPKYLTLNNDLIKIYNSDVDKTQLSFSSSSPIKSITLTDLDGDGHSAYYKNKYNNLINLSGSLLNSISASAESNVLNGRITITSPLTDGSGRANHNNTIRYLEFKVVNEDGVEATFRVEQYPLIYITNVVGWYSYRDDFLGSGQSKPTTYLERNGGVVSVGADNSTNPKYTYYTSFSGGGGFMGTPISGFWGSKVNRDVDGIGQYDDTQSGYNINYYRWSNATTLEYRSTSVGSNARMYHVRVTATSSEYTVGRPQILDANGDETLNVENGYTDPSSANARLVSPSFMIASQLGFVEISNANLSNNTRSFTIARDHCKNYVEVSADGEVYDDWRLPTAAEIGIILSLQGTSSGDNTKAIDYLLSAGSYFAAGGTVANPNGSGNPAIRCIRDAYQK